ncbi:methyltransferase domain-containing protein [Yinghuangia sp. YIM S09857]|uniref:methyltransferase domain-containing protein n=1 Tax=Yinghuangia sp. YIM S09857 TaxID=3436929 RepID=UPI003F536CD8
MPEHSAERLAAELAAAGHLRPDWADAWRAVDRAAFVPARVWVADPDGYRRFDRGDDPDRWRALVHSDTVLVTQVEGGTAEPEVSSWPTSSAMMPRMVAGMLAALDVADSHRVLEIGTGVGIGAALLSARLGDGSVTSIEVDPVVAAGARRSLDRAGWRPYLAVGDGMAGVPERAPFDRVLSTCSVRTVPWPWIAQTRPGGRVLTPWGTGLYNGVLLDLDVAEDADGRYATGRVVGDAAFMWERGQGTAPDSALGGMAKATMAPDCAPGGPVEATGTAVTTALDARVLSGSRDAAFAVGLMVPGVRAHVHRTAAGPLGAAALDALTLLLADEETGSWTRVEHVPGRTEFAAACFGPRDILGEVETALRWWYDAGRPARSRLGVTVRESGQAEWLDSPGNPVRAAAR